MKVTKAMVMSAGMGSRLEPLTLMVPKPLVPIANRPVMDILFENLSEIGIRDVVCNTYYLSEQIINRYNKNSFGINFNYIQEETLSGTAGGLKKCQFFFNKGETFVVLSADGLTNADILKGIEIHKKNKSIATIGIQAIPKENVSHFGVVVTDENGFITEFQEKPSTKDAKSNFINTGIYIFDYKIFDYIPENTFFDFAKNVFPQLLKERQINTFVIENYWNDIGTLDQYKLSNHDIFSGKCKINHNDIHITKSGSYITDTQLNDNICVMGECVIGKNCQFGKNITIENSIIWDNVSIKDNVHINNSIICSNQTVITDISNRVIGENKEIALV